MSEGREQTFAERGLPIVKDTGCKVGAHAFVWYGGSGELSEHEDTHRCLCGLMTWKEAHAD